MYDIRKKESLINSLLHLLKIDFSLVYLTSDQNSDRCLKFIQLVKEFELPISPQYNIIFKRIHNGKTPENELNELITPSLDFDNYVRNLLVNNFYNSNMIDSDQNSLEKQFKIYLNQVQGKISILFFIGLFIPIGICFLILFQVIKLLLLFLFIPVFLISLNLLFKKFVRNESYLIGMIHNYSSLEREKFKEFISFLKIFARNLKANVSPERAFVYSYSKNRSLFKLLRMPLKKHSSNLLSFESSIHEIFNILKKQLKLFRYSIFLDAIERYITKDSYYTADKIVEILEIIYQHQKLESKLDILLKGEKFKIFFFIIILPIITGVISGFFPFFSIVLQNLNFIDQNLDFFFSNPVNLYNIGLIISLMLSTISITANYFLNILNKKRKLPVIIGANLIFLITFLFLFLNVPTLI
ncbi:MAG: hypothetical protein ACW986_02480 [Promethearchaeota archaeon]|jgi:hypothetical protein